MYGLGLHFLVGIQNPNVFCLCFAFFKNDKMILLLTRAEIMLDLKSLDFGVILVKQIVSSISALCNVFLPVSETLGFGSCLRTESSSETMVQVSQVIDNYVILLRAVINVHLKTLSTFRVFPGTSSFKLGFKLENSQREYTPGISIVAPKVQSHPV